jgi:peptide-methionine (R)-S-oxide reductase
VLSLCLISFGAACSGTEPTGQSAPPSVAAAEPANAGSTGRTGSAAVAPVPVAEAPAVTMSKPDPTAPTEYNRLQGIEADVILRKGTERAGTGEYTDLDAEGTYICRQCNAPLYRSDDKFHSGCGWPSFDDEIDGAVDRHRDLSHGMLRVEITCQNCQGHLGHVFEGERMTEKDTRHCVNSVSMRFVPKGQPLPPKIVRKK